MTIPVRLQLARIKGFDLQATSLATNGLPAVNVARPSMWGNPFVIGEPCGVFPEGMGIRGQAETLIASLTREKSIDF